MDSQPFRLERKPTSEQVYDATADAAAAPPPAPLQLRPELDAALRAILDEPRAPGELTSTAFQRKEHALGAVFATLSPLEALALQHRLALADPADALATRFARLVSDRRARLLGFLTEIRRRAAATR